LLQKYFISLHNIGNLKLLDIAANFYLLEDKIVCKLERFSLYLPLALATISASVAAFSVRFQVALSSVAFV
jgi:hypothetical protein